MYLVYPVRNLQISIEPQHRGMAIVDSVNNTCFFCFPHEDTHPKADLCGSPTEIQPSTTCCQEAEPGSSSSFLTFGISCCSFLATKRACLIRASEYSANILAIIMLAKSLSDCFSIPRQFTCFGRPTWDPEHGSRLGYLGTWKDGWFAVVKYSNIFSNMNMK